MRPGRRLGHPTAHVFTTVSSPFAMTLLVVNIRLPDDFNPKTSDELLAALARLTDSFIAYIITFLLLAIFWTGQAANREEPEKASDAYA
jgi:uncharacterized membrane protein